MKQKHLCSLAILLAAGAAGFPLYAATPMFYHSFDAVSDAQGKCKGELLNGATLSKIGNKGVLDLGPNNGYFSFGSDFGSLIESINDDFAISLNLFIPQETAINANGNFIFSFANSSSTGYMFFGAKESRYSITPTSWTGEQTASANMAFPKGEWVNVVVMQKGNKAYVYIGGEKKAEAEVTMHPSDLGKTMLNWLGRSPYDGDVYLKNARYTDFKIFDSALTESEIAELNSDSDLQAINKAIYETEIDDAIKTMNYDFSAVRANISLPVSVGNGIKVVWESSKPEVITAAGVVTRPEVGKPNEEVTLKGTLSKGTATKSIEYKATVIAHLNDADAVAYDLDNMVIPGGNVRVRRNLTLPSSTPEGSYIQWSSDNSEYMTATGRLNKLAPKDSEGVKVVLTAKARRGNTTAERIFTITIAPEEDYDSYLFAYFPSNSNENLYYAISNDGFSYTPLNNGQRILASEDISLKGGIRDPHILRGEDGMFYMVATDMKCAEGWDSNRGMVLLKSPDMINWTSHTVHFPTRFPEWKNVTRVWAPEVIWDPDYVNTDGTKGRYMVYYSLLTNDGKCSYDKVFYSYANDDFSDLMTDPTYFFDRGSATIDADIIYDERDGLYHMVFKNEAIGGICQVTATRLTAEPRQPLGSQWSAPSQPLQQTNVAVEGAGMFRLINSDTWVLMYDCYNNGYYQFCTTEDLKNFTLKAQTATSGAFTPRHGTVIPITKSEREALLAAFPVATTARKITNARNINVRGNNFKCLSSTVYVPVYHGTDLSNFDPMFSVTPGASITPEGPQDFTKGSIDYTVTNGDKSTTYAVTVAVEANPVLPAFHADPEILFSCKTGRFYIYSTTDGISGWGGHSFTAYSSADLVNWREENCILDLKTDQVTWATGNAWAPCIEEKFEDGQYKYYFYFSGHNPEKNYKTLGCAVSSSPTGPFTDLGKPMVDTNITGGQLIDSDVFTDPETGDTYFYWGNGSLVASRLDKDMVTYHDARVITPAGGSLSDYAFREGVYVFYRQGTYYFMWSVDDTGAKNYHVAYGTSDSPMGPIKVAKDPIVIIQDSKNNIYGTGHNSVLNIPATDLWYIVYHRINKSYLSDGPGYHREVCIDKLEFNEDGTIKQVTPTHTGVEPLDMSGFMNALINGVESVEADAEHGEAVSVEWYDLKGVKVNADNVEPGLYVRTVKYADGTSKGDVVRLQ